MASQQVWQASWAGRRAVLIGQQRWQARRIGR
jgi:hypothetical protein